MDPREDARRVDVSATHTTPGIGSPSAPFAAGAALGGFRIEAPIGRGGTATVYRATDPHLQRAVALKVLDPHAMPQARERFLREVRIVATLRHPHVVLLYGAGEDRGYAWAAMELLPGSLAQELQRRGRLTSAEVAQAGREAALGLDVAWSRGIVHRDIKPSNLLRDERGSVKVADFGLAKDLSFDLHLTAPDVVLGTPLYVSPEQASGRAVGVVSDIYSLGATLYHLAAGRPPFQSSSALDVIVRHAVEPPPPLPADIAPGLARLILQMLAKNPAQRPQTYATVLASLEDAPLNDQADVDTEPELHAPRSSGATGVASSLLAAARAALELGRYNRVQTILAPLIERREAGWVQAAFILAQSHEQAGTLTDAERVLNLIAADARESDERAFALWSLGRLAERQSAAALDRAIQIYGRIADISSGLLPKTLIDARIAALRRRHATHSSSDASGKVQS